MSKASIAAAVAALVISTANAATKEVEYAHHDKWNDGHGQRLQWVRSGDQILYDTVCANREKGSLEYRDCRSTAKMYFRAQCKETGDQSGRFCKASNSFNPL